MDFEALIMEIKRLEGLLADSRLEANGLGLLLDDAEAEIHRLRLWIGE